MFLFVVGTAPTDRPSFPKRHADIGGREDSSGKYRLLEPKSNLFLSPLSWTCKTRAPPEPRPSPEMRHPPPRSDQAALHGEPPHYVSAGSRALLSLTSRQLVSFISLNMQQRHGAQVPSQVADRSAGASLRYPLSLTMLTRCQSNARRAGGGWWRGAPLAPPPRRRRRARRQS